MYKVSNPANAATPSVLGFTRVVYDCIDLHFPVQLLAHGPSYMERLPILNSLCTSSPILRISLYFWRCQIALWFLIFCYVLLVIKGVYIGGEVVGSGWRSWCWYVSMIVLQEAG